METEIEDCYDLQFGLSARYLEIFVSKKKPKWLSLIPDRQTSSFVLERGFPAVALRRGDTRRGLQVEAVGLAALPAPGLMG